MRRKIKTHEGSVVLIETEVIFKGRIAPLFWAPYSLDVFNRIWKLKGGSGGFIIRSIPADDDDDSYQNNNMHEPASAPPTSVCSVAPYHFATCTVGRVLI